MYGQVAAAVHELGPVDAVGHRVVHGGERFVGPVRICDETVSALRELADLAPLHQAKSLAALEAVTSARPGCPAVACFDTAFHATIPQGAATYALPRAWRERWGLRRFGFHGLSHAYAARRAAELLGRPPDGLRIVTCHLGAGASLAAVEAGRSIDTTMGFTPLEGIAAMAAAMGGLDAVVWTGGVGERAPAIRAAAADGLGFLGVRVASELNEAPTADRDVSARGATVRSLVVTAREDIEIARQVCEVLSRRL
jgi:acetate kinase